MIGHFNAVMLECKKKADTYTVHKMLFVRTCKINGF